MTDYRPHDPYGITRSIEPKHVLPQQAWRVDPHLPLAQDEIEIAVDCLNIDSASFIQIEKAAHGDLSKIANTILETVESRGKQHNPVTGSGGMLIGTITKMGPAYPKATYGINIGDRIATLVSLSLTPLHIRKIKEILPKSHQVKIEGTAVLFASSPIAKLPADIPEIMALSALDVCGAPGQAERLTKSGQNVAVIGGGGKSGVLILYQAKKKGAYTLAIEYSEKAAQEVSRFPFVDRVIVGDATKALECSERIKAVFPDGADLVFNCANVPETEMATILSARAGGLAYFFSMATNFQRAALGAEGLGADVTLLIGNGFTPGHSDLTLQSLRESKELFAYFEKHAAGGLHGTP